MRYLVPLVAFSLFSVPPIQAAPESTALLKDITAGLKLVDEIDTASVAPVYESEEGVSKVTDILGKPARIMPPGEKAAAIAYVIGKGKGLKPGNAYVLAIDFPDDVSRSIFVANRGADYTRGIVTGAATGDVRAQFAEPSVESLNYPQTGEWQTFKQFFSLLNRFQGVQSVRDPKPGCRPHLPEDGFHVVIFQPKQINDPRSEGVAIGSIRLYEVADPAALYAPLNRPEGLPQRHVFWREEMADQLLQTTDPSIQAVDDSVDWYMHKIRMAKVLGIDTLCKDLLEFGFNQGWETGDENWVMHAQPPNRDLWNRLVPKAVAEGMKLLPYYEYKTAIGGADDSLAKQRRAHKLYHDVKETCGNLHQYTCVYWTEGHNGDVTDPDTLADAKRLLDKTITEFKESAHFAGAWFRTRANHLPMSFSEAAIERFKKDHPGDEAAQAADQKALIASYEGDKALYDKYVAWWFKKRAEFLSALQQYLQEKTGNKDAQILFTAQTSEAVPPLHGKDHYFNHCGVVTDDPDWWTAYANTLPEGYWKYHWMPTPYEKAVSEDQYRWVLQEKPPISHPMNHSSQEEFHAAPHADPENYKSIKGVMMTFPIGRMFTVANPQLLEDFRAASGLTVVKHYSLNEEAENPNAEPSPFGHLVGYISVDTDRAGDHLMLQQARAVAYGDPRNIGYLSGSSFSTGFPEVMRRFNQAFLALPALPSTRIEASSDPEVVVREIKTDGKGTYYAVVNTSMTKKSGVKVELPAEGKAKNLVTGQAVERTLTLDLDSAELHAYHVAK